MKSEGSTDLSYSVDYICLPIAITTNAFFTLNPYFIKSLKMDIMVLVGIEMM